MTAEEAGASDQLALIGPRGGLFPKPPRPPTPHRRAPQQPVARVLLDSPLPRLDRSFDYLVPAELDDEVKLGARVRVRFGRQRMEGWVLARGDGPEHDGALQWVEAVAASRPMLTQQSLALSRQVAAHYLGTLSDVLRLAVPPRVGSGGEAPAEAVGLALPGGPVDTALRLGAGRWVWTCPPGQDWVRWYAGTLAETAAAGERGLAVVPDGRDLRRLESALTALLPRTSFAVLTASLPPAQRYREFRSVLDGSVPIVIGTRSAAFAPLADPAALLLWDDGDDSHVERRAPYPHAREVLAMRSGAAATFIVGSYSRTPHTQRWIEIGWAQPVPVPRGDLRRNAPRVRATDDEAGPGGPGERAGRLPSNAGAAIRSGLSAGPVLVSVGRTGYVPRLRCRDCGHPADCLRCGAALLLEQTGGPPTCSRCARAADAWRCPDCGGAQLRSGAVGSRRTAEELGRAFPNVPVVNSSGERIVDEVPDRPALVVATPGAEPVAAGGYSAVVLLDVAAALAIPGLRSAEQAVRRWFAVAALARPQAPLVIVAEPGEPVVQALIRWDPGWFAERELANRRHAGMPPARRVVEATGLREDLDELRPLLPADAQILGPVAVGEKERILVTVEHKDGRELQQVLRAFVVRRSAASARPVWFRVDPNDLL